MIVSLDLPEELVQRLDAAVVSRRNLKDSEPQWPFKTPTVVESKLSAADLATLNTYRAALAAYRLKFAAEDGKLYNSRSAYATILLEKYLGKKGKQ